MHNYLALAATILTAGPAAAQDKSLDTTARYFLIQASIGNVHEAAEGHLAVDHAGAPDVKAFGQRMVTDHNNAEVQLVQVAKASGIALPHEATDPPVPDPMLQKLQGKDFDRMYVHMMVPGHRQTVQLFEKYAVTGKNPAVRAFAQATLPVLKEHLAAIVALDKNN